MKNDLCYDRKKFKNENEFGYVPKLETNPIKIVSDSGLYFYPVRIAKFPEFKNNRCQ
jgi:hypothetical protein